MIAMHLDLISRGNSSGTCGAKCLRRIVKYYLAYTSLYVFLFIYRISRSAHIYHRYMFHLDADSLLIPYMCVIYCRSAKALRMIDWVCMSEVIVRPEFGSLFGVMR